MHEIVDHLVESHRPAIPQLTELLDGRTPESLAIPPSLQSPAPFERPWEELVADLCGIHGALLDLLAGAGDDVPLDARAPVAIVVKVASGPGEPVPVAWEERLDWKAYIQAIRGHTAQHKAQILRTLAAMGHEDPSAGAGGRAAAATP